MNSSTQTKNILYQFNANNKLLLCLPHKSKYVGLRYRKITRAGCRLLCDAWHFKGVCIWVSKWKLVKTRRKWLANRYKYLIVSIIYISRLLYCDLVQMKKGDERNVSFVVLFVSLIIIFFWFYFIAWCLCFTLIFQSNE